jgi:hypothetical protein
MAGTTRLELATSAVTEFVETVASRYTFRLSETASVNTSAFPGTNPIVSVESGDHLAPELETRCLTATAVKLG